MPCLLLIGQLGQIRCSHWPAADSEELGQSGAAGLATLAELQIELSVLRSDSVITRGGQSCHLDHQLQSDQICQSIHSIHSSRWSSLLYLQIGVYRNDPNRQRFSPFFPGLLRVSCWEEFIVISITKEELRPPAIGLRRITQHPENTREIVNQANVSP